MMPKRHRGLYKGDTRPFKRLPIAKIVETARVQHGFPEEHYETYSAYCLSRCMALRRILKADYKAEFDTIQYLDFTIRPITDRDLVDIRILELVILEVEFLLASGLQRKPTEESTNKSKRKKRSMKFFEKAAKCAHTFRFVVKRSRRVDEYTKLEAGAYALTIDGIVKFEEEKFKKGIEDFTKARNLYDRVCSMTCEDHLITVYDAKIQELSQKIDNYLDPVDTLPDFSKLTLEDPVDY